MFNELILHLVLYQPIQHAGPDHKLAFRHLITQAASNQYFARDSLWSLDPLHLQLLVSNAVKQHFVFLVLIDELLDLPLLRLQVPICHEDVILEFAVHPGIELSECTFSLLHLEFILPFKVVYGQPNLP